MSLCSLDNESMNIQGIIRETVGVLENGNAAEKERAAVTLYKHSRTYPDEIRRAGGIFYLVKLASGGTQGQKMWAAAALSLCAYRHPINQIAIREAGGTVPLADMRERARQVLLRSIEAAGTIKETTVLQNLEVENAAALLGRLGGDLAAVEDQVVSNAVRLAPQIAAGNGAALQELVASDEAAMGASQRRHPTSQSANGEAGGTVPSRSRDLEGWSSKKGWC